MRIPSGVTDQYIYFVAVDATDLKTRETGLTSFTVYRSRNGGAAAAFTTPTINETDATNMPGVYELLLDEDMTIDAGDDSQEMVFHITQASMAPVTRVIELYRPKLTAGQTLTVTASRAETSVQSIAANAITATAIATGAITSGKFAASAINAAAIATDAITSAKIAASALNGKGDWNIGKTGYSLTQSFPSNFADLAITVTTGQVTVGTNNDKTGYTASTVSDKTGYSISGTKTTLDALNDITAANVNTEVSDVLKTDTVTLPGQTAPPATPTLEQAISWLYKVFRNKTDQTTTLWQLYDDAGTTVDSKATVSESAGTATKEEIVSGP